MNELTGNLDIPGLGDVQQAHARLQSRVRNTPVLNDAGLDAALGCKLYCKCEHLQRTGAFKFRVKPCGLRDTKFSMKARSISSKQIVARALRVTWTR